MTPEELQKFAENIQKQHDEFVADVNEKLGNAATAKQHNDLSKRVEEIAAKLDVKPAEKPKATLPGKVITLTLKLKKGDLNQSGEAVNTDTTEKRKYKFVTPQFSHKGTVYTAEELSQDENKVAIELAQLGAGCLKLQLD